LSFSSLREKEREKEVRELTKKDFRKRFFLLFTVLLFAFPTVARSDSFSSLNKKGNRNYNGGLFDEALKYYLEAEVKNPTSPELSYNLGNVFYQKQNYKEALSKYSKALDLKDSLDLANDYYNLGNTFYRSGKYQQAIETYQRSLGINPEDEDAKYNLELVKKKMEKMLQNEQKKQKEKKEDKEKEREEEEKRPEEQKGQKDQEEKQKEKKPEETKGEEEKQEKKEAQLPLPQEGMTKEDAERILNAIKDDEKELQKKKSKFLSKKTVKVGKDW